MEKQKVESNIIIATQVRNAIEIILRDNLVELVDIDDPNFYVSIHNYTQYIISTDYFLCIDSVEDFDYFIQKPYKYIRDINLCLVYDKVLEMAFGNTEPTWSQRKDIHYLFDMLSDREIEVHYFVEYLDDEYIYEYVDYLDDIS